METNTDDFFNLIDMVDSTELRNHFIKNVSGFSVIALHYFTKEKSDLVEIKEAAYHLHFLYSYNNINDMLTILCLDTNQFSSVSDYNKLNYEEKENQRNNSINVLLNTFVKRSITFARSNTNIEKKDLLNDADKEYWTSFNTIKKDNYFSGIEFFFQKQRDLKKEVNEIIFKYEESPVSSVQAEKELEFLNILPKAV